jgi:type IV pilus assembly protein PilM
MGLMSLFRKKEPLLSIDIGSSSVKLIELDLTGAAPRLVNIAMAPLPADAVVNNSIAKSDVVSQQIAALIEANSISPKRVTLALPGPSVFTKKIKIDSIDYSELPSFIQMEAGNYIPHDIDAVRLDYHVCGYTEDDQMEVLLVAVKNDVIDSYLETLALSSLEAAVVDVDYFASQNMFEFNYSDLVDSTVAVLNIGSRYTTINICHSGDSLFTGDIAVGGRSISEALVDELGISFEEAEKIKRKFDPNKSEFDNVKDIIDKNVEYMASEYARQLSLFWNASGMEGGIDKILLSGGSAGISGMSNAIKEKTQIDCEVINPFKQIACGETFDEDYLKEISPYMGVAVGLALRQAGDKVYPEAD